MVDKDNDCEKDEAQAELLGKLLLHIDLVTQIEEEEDDEDHMEEVNDAFHFGRLWSGVEYLYHQIT